MGYLDTDVYGIPPSNRWQAEKANSIVERYLRTLTAANERHWDRLLAMAKFYNSCVQKATGISPFKADTVENPRMPLDVLAAASRRPGGCPDGQGTGRVPTLDVCATLCCLVSFESLMGGHSIWLEGAVLVTKILLLLLGRSGSRLHGNSR